MSEEISLDISMSEDKWNKIKDILGNAKGLRHYACELKTGEYLDLVEYKDYEKLQQENQQLKSDFDLYKDNHIYKNYEVERKDKQLDLYKSVINELRELITVNTCWDTTTKKAFEILSKVEGSDK